MSAGGTQTISEKPLGATGGGIYTLAFAARILGVQAAKLRRWVEGYSYLIHGEKHRPSAQPPIVRSSLPRLENVTALSFLELVELGVVHSLVGSGVSLQHIRLAHKAAAQVFKTTHPFAMKKIYTDGKKVISHPPFPTKSSDFIELTKNRNLQLQFGAIVAPFLEKVEYSSRTDEAHRYWPLGENHLVVLDPLLAFGAPTIAGTRLRTASIVRHARVESVKSAMSTFGILKDQVEAAIELETRLQDAS